MTKPARCTDPRRAQRGDALLEALVGILLLVLIKKGKLKTKPYEGKYCVIPPEELEEK